MADFVRGAAISITQTFTDAEGSPVTPTGATLYIDYRADGIRVTETLVMDETAGSFNAVWDSALSDPGQIFYHIRTTAPPDVIAIDGDFNLVANRSNPVAA
jgi:hypothetical protein